MRRVSTLAMPAQHRRLGNNVRLQTVIVADHVPSSWQMIDGVPANVGRQVPFTWTSDAPATVAGKIVESSSSAGHTRGTGVVGSGVGGAVVGGAVVGGMVGVGNSKLSAVLGGAMADQTAPVKPPARYTIWSWVNTAPPSAGVAPTTANSPPTKS